jgi:hypothetical protein
VSKNAEWLIMNEMFRFGFSAGARKLAGLACGIP